jgi:ribosomal-protein-alanine N-acetyltransferase
MCFSNMLINLKSYRLELKTLTHSDATSQYLDWFKTENIKKHIYAAKSEQTIDTIRQYIEEKLQSDNTLFLGIFRDDTHIGNIKFDAIDRKKGSAEMGIMIGEESWRGKGVFAESMNSACEFLKSKHGIKKVILGVEKENTPAVKAYEKLGFKITKDHGETYEMEYFT